MAICVMPVVAAAPCQCFTPGGIQTTSPGADLLDGATPVLYQSDAGRDDQRLAKRMRVPSGAGAGLKGHRSAADPRRRATLKTAVDAYRAREVLGGTDAGAWEPARWTTMSWLLWAKADAVESSMANSLKAGTNMALPPFGKRRRRCGLLSARAPPSPLLEDLAGDRDRRDGVRPAGIEGELRDRLDELDLGHAVLPRQCEMGAKLVGTVQRDQGADGDEAAIALGETRPLPDVAEQHVVGEFRHLRRDVAHQLLGA